MAKNMESSIKNSFLKANIVTDRFHVVKLVIDALQHIRIKYRWIEIDQENKMISLAKKEGIQYSQRQLSNGDSFKQLLARSRYLLAKNANTWTENQEERSIILFREFPLLKRIYNHVGTIPQI